jgi:hypothetical protein
MKNKSVTTKILATTLSAIFLYASFLNQAQAQCAATIQVNAVSKVDCACTGGPLSGGCYNSQITPLGGYNTCTTTNSSGYMSCGSGTPFDYYTTTTCASSLNTAGMAKCLLSLLGSGLAGAAVLANCFTPIGLFSLGAGCEASLLAAGATTGGTRLSCTACSMTTCTADNTTANDTWVTASSADSNSGQCPPQG